MSDHKITQYKLNMSNFSISRVYISLTNFMTMKNLQVQKLDDFFLNDEECDVSNSIM